MAESHLKVGELAACAGVGVQTLHYYEQLGLLPKTGRSASNYRLYPSAALRRVQFIKKAQVLGFALGNAVTRSLAITVAAVALGGTSFITNQFQFAILGATNYDYVVLRSEDLANWFAVATSRGPFIFTETNPIAQRRYFRALVQP
jgi:hypothetical protein